MAKKKKQPKVEPYIPRFKRPPNKFLRYEMEDFNDGAGNGGEKRVAVFIDKDGNQQRMDAQIIWQYGWYMGITESEFKNV